MLCAQPVHDGLPLTPVEESPCGCGDQDACDDQYEEDLGLKPPGGKTVRTHREGATFPLGADVLLAFAAIES